MVDTARHGCTKWAAGFTQSDILLNELLDKLEAKVGLSVKSRTTAAQPGAPTAGDAYIIPASATGAAWSTFTQHDIAYWDGTTWTAYTPITGWPSWVEDDANGVLFNGASWVIVSADLSAYLQEADIDTVAELNAILTDGPLATEAFVNSATAGLLDYKGGYDAATNAPDLDTAPSGIKKGDTYTVTVAGDFFAAAVEAGDMLIAEQDDPTLEDHWTIVNKNIDASTAFDGTKYVGVNDQTGTAYELVLADAGKLVTMSNAAANTLTIPANAAVAFEVGTRIDVMQKGAGQTTVAITTDALNGAGGLKISAQWETVSLLKIAATEWVLVGGVA